MVSELGGVSEQGLVSKLAEFGLAEALIVTEEVDQNLYLSSRNVLGIDVRDVSAVDPVSLISHDKVLVTVGALKALEEALS